MAKLLAFLACEKAVLEEGSAMLSIIAVMQELRALIPPGTTPPKDVVAPVQWSAVSIWQRENADIGHEYEAKTVLTSPSGTVLTESPASIFRFEKPYHRLINRFFGFRVSTLGRYHLLLMMREVGQGDFQEIARYPIDVAYSDKPLG